MPDTLNAKLTRRLSAMVPYAALTAIALLGVGVSIGFSLMTYRRSAGVLQESFAQVADDYAQFLQNDLTRYLKDLEAIKAFYASSHVVDRDGFHTFVQALVLPGSVIHAVAWVPRVAEADRAGYEEAARLAGHRDFQFLDYGAQHQTQSAATRPEYFPVYYLEPFDGNEALLGVDLSTEEALQEAMVLARDMDSAVMTPRLPILQGSGGGWMCVGIVPVYRNGVVHETLRERREHLAGFLVEQVRISVLVAGVMQRVGHPYADMYLHDETGNVGERLLYEAASPRATPASAGMDDKLYWTGTVEAANRRWTLIVRARPEFLSAHALPWDTWGMLAVGLLLTLLAVLFIGNELTRANQVERLVTKRTAELSEEVQEREHAETVLSDTSEHLRSLVANVPGAVYRYACESEWRVEFFSEGIADVSGYPAAEFVDRAVQMYRNVIHPEDRVRVEQSLQAALQRQEAYQLEYRLQHKDGSIRWVFDRGQGVWNPAGQLLRIEGVILDQTERKRSEEERQAQASLLLQTNEELSRREKVMQSLLEDLQTSKDELEDQWRKLEEANRRLVKLSVLKDEFVANVSHELRTPLTAIKEGVGLLLDEALGPVTDEQKDFLQIMDQSIDRLTELISNMLDISKIEAGRLRLIRRRVDLANLVESTLKSYQAIAGKRKVVAKIEELSPVFVDSNRVLQVLGNLFSNAVKFTRDDGSIMFTVKRQEGQALLCVADDGVGIAKEDIPKLFQKFSQVGQGEGKPRGTGLGLALCKELIELHNGVIWVDSVSGQGSQFYFTLPFYSAELALQGSFDEHVMLAKREGGDSVGMIALKVDRAEPQMVGHPLQPEELQNISEAVRKHLHRGDVVLPMDPEWVIVLAVADADGIQAILERLQKTLPATLASTMPTLALQLGFGSALYPFDGADAEAVFAKATEPLKPKVAAMPPQPRGSS